jgi:hypothetical protein
MGGGRERMMGEEGKGRERENLSNSTLTDLLLFRQVRVGEAGSFSMQILK